MIDAALLLPKILAEAGQNSDMTEVAAKIAWSRAAGSGLRRHAVAFRLYGKTLIVSVADVIWQKQLQSMSSELIVRINRLLRQNVVNFIEFRIDRSALSQVNQPVSEKRNAEMLQHVSAEVSAAAGAIADPELRQLFMRAAGNCIARRVARASRP